MFLIVLVAALGYFVDVYDLILFSVVRRASLLDLGVPESDLLSVGVTILNSQMLGMLLGGVLWGILGDKKGRVSVLLGSIFVYSVANILNGFVHSTDSYIVCRFVAGIGLAGELGAGITLVSEILSKETRGYGTTIVASVGVSGAVVAALVGDKFHWRISYFIGGGLGLSLLLLRASVYESGLFNTVKTVDVSRGNLLLLVRSRERLMRYLRCILCGVPVWFVVGVIITFSPEIGPAIGMVVPPKAGPAVMYCYIGLVFGDLVSGVLSQVFKSRRKVLFGFVTLTGVLVFCVLRSHALLVSEFYIFCGALGFAVGYWVVFMTIAAEQFGTNLRATVTTTVPNFVRGSVVPVTIVFRYLQGHVGIVQSALIVGAGCVALAIFALYEMEESWGKDLDFLEQ